MSQPFVVYDNNEGGVQQFAVPFPYLARDHVLVQYNDDGSPILYTWVNNGMIQTDPLEPGREVRVFRITPRDTPLVTFVDGSTFSAKQQNLQNLQAFYVIQEFFYSTNNFLGIDPTHAGLAVDARDAAQQARNVAQAILALVEVLRAETQVDREAAYEAYLGALQARDIAENFKLDTEVFKLDAEEAANLAKAVELEVQSLRDESEAFKLASEVAQGAAETARDQAQVSAQAANGSASAAAGHASNAQSSASDASSSASAAQAAVVAAETSREGAESAASAASSSSQSAASFADDAETSAAAATTARNEAQTARSEAQTFRNEAATSASDAASSAATATTEAGLAVTARDAAQGAATAAASSATSASASATAAEQQAQVANTERLAAETARGEAQSFSSQAVQARDAAEGFSATAQQAAGVVSSFQNNLIPVALGNDLWTMPLFNAVQPPEVTPTFTDWTVNPQTGAIAAIRGPNNTTFGPKAFVPVYPGRLYKLVVQFVLIEGVTQCRMGYYGRNPDGVATALNSQRDGAFIADTPGTLYTEECLLGFAGTPGVQLAFAPGTVDVRLQFRVGWSAPPRNTGVVHIIRFDFLDVTDESRIEATANTALQTAVDAESAVAAITSAVEAQFNSWGDFVDTAVDTEATAINALQVATDAEASLAAITSAVEAEYTSWQGFLDATVEVDARASNALQVATDAEAAVASITSIVEAEYNSWGAFVGNTAQAIATAEEVVARQYLSVVAGGSGATLELLAWDGTPGQGSAILLDADSVVVPGSITAGLLTAGEVITSSAQIRDLTVERIKIANGAVTTFTVISSPVTFNGQTPYNSDALIGTHSLVMPSDPALVPERLVCRPRISGFLPVILSLASGSWGGFYRIRIKRQRGAQVVELKNYMEPFWQFVTDGTRMTQVLYAGSRPSAVVQIVGDGNYQPGDTMIFEYYWQRFRTGSVNAAVDILSYDLEVEEYFR